MIRVYLEQGSRWTFAAALDWPGWCRRAKGGDEAAIDELLGYAPRFAEVVGTDVDAGEVQVVGRVAGDASTDFGAPGAVGPWDDEPVTDDELARQVDVLRHCWTYFDGVVAGAPAELRKGPRGGGRDRDTMVDHVREAERSYGRKLGVAVPPRTPWPEQRELIAAATLARPESRWPARYGLRRVAWHVLDHAWEMQDRTP